MDPTVLILNSHRVRSGLCGVGAGGGWIDELDHGGPGAQTVYLLGVKDGGANYATFTADDGEELGEGDVGDVEDYSSALGGPPGGRGWCAFEAGIAVGVHWE